MLARRLLAAAAVHMAVEMRGSKVQVELKKDLANLGSSFEYRIAFVCR